MLVIPLAPLWLTAWVLFLPPLPQTTVTPADTLAMMAEVPARGTDRPGHYERGRDAQVIADGIAQAVDEETETVLDSPREDAALLVVFAAWESGNRSCVSGDGGKALGALQLHGARALIACDPHLAAREWLRRAREAMVVCVNVPREDRLALLASGSCGRARGLSRKRVGVARSIAAGKIKP